ncbi:MAG: RNA 2',3'-cyclic phosphodiesterase [Euryarchaeota archaeon]|nr:RNA 2',3'-cyclic phosphodiesterase [Euryarchaeota archaeon]
MPKFRGFIAVKIPFTESMKELWDDVRKSGARIKLVEPHNVHITLKFLGDTEESLVPRIEAIMKKAVMDVNPFEVELYGCGAFPSPSRPRVVWIGVREGADVLKTIAERIDQEVSKLGFQRETRPFVAHATVGRVKGHIGGLPRVINEWSNRSFGKFEVKEILLMKSILRPEGPEYHEVRRVLVGKE